MITPPKNLDDSNLDDSNLAFDVLQYLDYAILERKGPHNYSLLGSPPEFYLELFGYSPDQENCSPWEHSYMLESFFADAELFFKHAETGRLFSGIWQEESLDNADKMFFAEACILKDHRIVIIHQLQTGYTSHIGILRKSRAELLQNRNLTKQLESLKGKTRTDFLTNIANRDAFIEFTQSKLDSTKKAGDTFALGLIDVDNFKHINDNYGHLMGDKALTTIANIIHTNLRKQDLVARFGGDEFVICLSTSDPQTVLKIADKLRTKVASVKLEGLLDVTISVGCTIVTQKDTLADALKRADFALYDAKKAGKNNAKII